MERQPAVYVLASRRNGTLYIGVTSDLVKRIWQHREHFAQGFSSQHDVTRLVWFELHQDMYAAIEREKRLKKWKREWKVALIEARNPSWRDLWPLISGGGDCSGTGYEYPLVIGYRRSLPNALRDTFGPGAD